MVVTKFASHHSGAIEVIDLIRRGHSHQPVSASSEGSRESSPMGHHLFVDYVNFWPRADKVGEWVLSIMREAVRGAGVREVHTHCEEFSGKVSPPGFAAIVLIDESHVTAHCYADRGILAIDVFTCGSHDPKDIADSIHRRLASECPEMEVSQRREVGRFVV